MYQFFAEPSQIEGKIIRITGQDVNHIKNVLRMREREQLSICDGQEKEYTCYIESIGKDEIVARVMYVQEKDVELDGRLSLFQSLPKGDKMELIIQKAVELGVWEVIPVATSRCVMKLDEKKAVKKVARWQQIAESASKQSKRLRVPEIHRVCGFREALAYCQNFDVKVIPYELAEGMSQTREIISNIKKGQSVAVFIGPEGGFSEEEIELASSQEVIPITLGRRILRTETAGIALLSVLMFHLEEE